MTITGVQFPPNIIVPTPPFYASVSIDASVNGAMNASYKKYGAGGVIGDYLVPSFEAGCKFGLLRLLDPTEFQAAEWMAAAAAFGIDEKLVLYFRPQNVDMESVEAILSYWKGPVVVEGSGMADPNVADEHACIRDIFHLNGNLMATEPSIFKKDIFAVKSGYACVIADNEFANYASFAPGAGPTPDDKWTWGVNFAIPPWKTEGGCYRWYTGEWTPPGVSEGDAGDVVRLLRPWYQWSKWARGFIVPADFFSHLGVTVPWIVAPPKELDRLQTESLR